MRDNNLPSNSKEKFFKGKMEEYNELIKKRDDCKTMIKKFKNTLMYLNNIDNDKNIFKSSLQELKIDFHSDISLCSYLSQQIITKDECPKLVFEYSAKEDIDMVINIIKAIIETYYQRYEDVNERIKNFDFLMGIEGDY